MFRQVSIIALAIAPFALAGCGGEPPAIEQDGGAVVVPAAPQTAPSATASPYVEKPATTLPLVEKPAKAKPPAVEQRWPNLAAVIAAAPAEPLVTHRFYMGKDWYLIDAPAECADAGISGVLDLTSQVTLQIESARENASWWKDRETQWGFGPLSYPFLDNRLLIVKYSAEKNKASEEGYLGYLFKSDAYHDYFIKIVNRSETNGRFVPLPQLLLAVKCAETLRREYAFPSDRLELAELLGVQYQPADEVSATPARLVIGQFATRSTLNLVTHFPEVTQVVFEAPGQFDQPGDMAILAQMPDLRGVVLNHSSAKSVERLEELKAVVQCPKLQQLTVGFWGNEAYFQLLARASTLQELTLPAKLSWPTGVEALAGLPKLHTLHLTGDDPFTLENWLRPAATFPALQTLLLTAPLTEAELQALTLLPHLHTVGIESEKLTGEPIAGLSELRALQELRLKAGPPLVPLSAAAIQQWPRQLKVIELQRFALGDAALAELIKLPAVESLRWHDCDVSPAGIAQLAAMKTLRQVQFTGAKTAQFRAALKAARPELSGE